MSRDGELTTFARSDSFSCPNGIAAGPTGSYLYINDYLGDKSAEPIANPPFRVRRIELPRLYRIVKYELDAGSQEAAAAAYRAYRDDPMNAGEITEPEINSLGWSCLIKGEYADATFVLELNAGSYPDS